MSNLIIFTAPKSVDGPPPSSPAAVLASEKRTREVYTQAAQNPLTSYFGRSQCPDPTIAKFGGGKGFDLYYQMRRQITELGGIVEQLVDAVLRRRPTIIPGDLSDSQSVEVARTMRRVWDDIPGTAVSIRKSVDTLITCGFAPIELVWDRDPYTGVVAPIGAVGPDGRRRPGLIDRPAQNFIFDAENNPRFLSVVDSTNGQPLEPLKFIFLRAGSLNTEWGESQFPEIYSAGWLYQQVRKFMLEAVEKFGRPIPHVLIPRTYSPADVADLDHFYRENFGNYTRALYDGTEVKVEYPSMAMASSGAAGRAEIEVLRFLQGTMYIRLLRTQQTQDKTGGSRALETTRQSITDAAALTFSDVLCQGLQDGFMRPVMEINYPDLDPALWPRFVPDPLATMDRNAMHAAVVDGIDRGILYSKEWYFRAFGAAEAKDDGDVLGHPNLPVFKGGKYVQPGGPEFDDGSLPPDQTDGDPEGETTNETGNSATPAE